MLTFCKQSQSLELSKPNQADTGMEVSLETRNTNILENAVKTGTGRMTLRKAVLNFQET